MEKGSDKKEVVTPDPIRQKIWKLPHKTGGDRNHLSVVVRDRTGILFEGITDSISSLNENGPFDVLPLHANFISVIHTRVAIRSDGQIKKEFPVTSGVMRVTANTAEIYLGVVRPQEK